MNKKHEVLVLGDGAIGLSAAVALKKQGCDVALVARQTDQAKQQPKAPPPHLDPWVCALNAASKKQLEDCGIWQALEASMGHYYDVAIFDHTGDAALTFHAETLGHPALGYVVAQRALKQHLNDARTLLKVPTYHAEATGYEKKHKTLHLSNGQSIHADCFWAADGAQSWFRTILEIPLTTHDYQQQATVTTVRSSKPHQHIARQRFVRSGPIALLPLKDPHASALVYSADFPDAQKLQALSDKAFAQNLTDTLAMPELGALSIEGKRQTFPLKAQHATVYHQDGVWLLGDAAHVIHPLAGQGMNLGFADVHEAVKQVRERGHSDWMTAGQRYQRARRGDNSNMMQAMTGLLWLFQNNNPGLKNIRTWGMSQLNACHWLKHKMVLKALGLTRC
jgi:2-polyprenylphenol 6-hydroxylase